MGDTDQTSSNERPFRVGVAGCGAIGRNHARLMAELAAGSGGAIEFAAIHESNPEVAESISSQFNVPVARDLEHFAKCVDAATVAVPTVHHRAVAEVLLHRDCHVLIEKPITERLDDAEFLIRLAEERGCILQVGHIERFNPVLRSLEEKLTAPRFIEVHRLSPFPNRSMDIGVVLDVMIHDLEIVLHLVKSPLVEVDAVGVPVLTQREDIANARLKFADGCIANLTASRISPEKLRKIRVFQSDCYVSLDYQDQSGSIYRKDGLAIVKEEVEIEKDEPLKLEIFAFVECARHGRRPVVGGQEGAEALQLALEITERIRANAALAQPAS
jgi:predicted dehydrogenase